MFNSDTKFDSNSGLNSWSPSNKMHKENIDYGYKILREVVCVNCSYHQGLVFDDEPIPLEWI